MKAISLRLSWILSCAVLLAGGGTLALAQTTGNVAGTVADQNQALIPSVTLRLINQATNVAVTQKSTDTGSYYFTAVQPGTYSLSADHQGFKPAVTSGIIVVGDGTVTINVHLEVGTENQTVTVSAEHQNDVDVATAVLSTTVTTNMIQNMPNMNRNVLQNITQAPGVDFTQQAEGGSQVVNIVDVSANVNGNHEQRNNFYLDGIDNTGSFRNYAMQMPNPDAVQEVESATSNSSAEWGREAGGEFNVITKSGTNQFHGSAYYFFRPVNLSSNSWSHKWTTAATPASRTPDRQKQWGGTLGGPVLLPHIYNGHDRTFFFFSLLRYDNHGTGVQNSNWGIVPGMLNGDFSSLLSDPGGPIQLYDPDTGALLVNNQLPLSKMDPVGLKFLQMVPQVAKWGQAFTWTYQNPVTNMEYVGKLDHHWTGAQVTTVSILRTSGLGDYPRTAAGLNNDPNYPGEDDTNGQWTNSIHHNYALRPNFMVEGYVGMNRQSANRGMAPGGNSYTLADMGAKNVPISQVGARKFAPGFLASGALQAEQGYISLFYDTNYHFGAKSTYVRGRHTIKFGFDSERQKITQLNDADGAYMGFNGRFSGMILQNSNGPNATNRGGASFADMYMGRANRWGQSGILHEQLVDWSNFFFFQDAWQITPRLTLTPGVRYEYFLPIRELNNRATGYVAGYQSTLFPSAPVGLAFQGDPGIPKGFINTDWGKLQPRLGLAYDIMGNGKWAIHLGLGKYVSSYTAQVMMLDAENNPWRPGISCGSGSPNGTIASDPWEKCSTGQFPTPPTPFVQPTSGAYNWAAKISSAYGFDPSFKSPYSLQYNVGLEHEVAKNVSVSAAYVGNINRNVAVFFPTNYSRWVNVGTAPPSSTNSIARQPNQLYSTLNTIYSTGKSSYNSFQLVGHIRRNGVDANITYVEQRDWDNVAGTEGNQDPTGGGSLTANPECGVSLACERAQQLRHRELRGFAVYDLPFFKHYNNLLSKTVGGWQVSGVVDMYSGMPSDVQIGQDWNWDGVGGDRPDKVGPIQYVKTNLHNTTNPSLPNYQWLNTGGRGSNDPTTKALWTQRGPFALPASHQNFGTLPRMAVFNPGGWSFDGAVMKNFHITESHYIEARAEATNVLNHPVLNGIDTTYQDANFGYISGKNGNRKVELSAHYRF